VGEGGPAAAEARLHGDDDVGGQVAAEASKHRRRGAG
jgi:hypothetical protein